MKDDKRKEITSILANAKWILALGVLVILLIPVLLALPAFSKIFDFSGKGEIGDTIGGTTAPFLNLIGAALIFFALKAQVKANELIQEQIDHDNDEKENEHETSNLNQLYAYLEQSINNFKFTSFPIEDLRHVDDVEATTTVYGGEAFYKVFNQIRCHYHGSQENLFSNQAVSELYSILTVMELLLNKLDGSKSRNREILRTLIKHQLDYRIITRIRDEDIPNLHLRFCDSCQCNHGLPDELRLLIGRIKEKFSEPIQQVTAVLKEEVTS